MPGQAEQAGGPGTMPDARAFEAVVAVAQEFCPQLEVLRPGLCAFGVRGPARYFGGEAELAGKIVASVAQLGFGCGTGVADGTFAALLASRDALISGTPAVIVPVRGTPAYLAPRSVTVLGEPELAELLVRLGIRTLGDLAELTATDVENRFGPQGRLAHRLARGLDPRPLVTRPPSTDVSAELEFDPPAGQSEPVVFAAKALAGQMHAKLAANGLACVRLSIQVTCDSGQEITRLWRHDGLLSDLAVAERVRWQLDGWLTKRAHDSDEEADGAQAGGICLLRLVPDQLVRDHGRQLGLWGDAVVSDRVARAAVRVQAMLGHDAVRQPVLTGGRGPADQAVFVPFGDAPLAPRPTARPWPGQIPAPAPATVYQVPRPARVTDSSGTLVTLTGRGELSDNLAWLSVAGGRVLAITAWTGPWPVTERWWDQVRACRKARFQVVTVDGSAWLAVIKDGDWFIEACYD
ncbi:MAG TPA: DNA polymerase Y family protein [Streptosporangiaceae bacterium]|nr:DNA polymerase Y family protein [Streptosporangiaceae bacterium]